MVELHSSSFRMITTNILGVRIFRKFTVVYVTDCSKALVLVLFLFWVVFFATGLFMLSLILCFVLMIFPVLFSIVTTSLG